MTLDQVRRLVVLAAEARGVLVLSEEFTPSATRFSCSLVTADGTDVTVTVQRDRQHSPQPWTVANGDGEQWSAGECSDAILHAVGEALGDKEEAES